jgi:hypothetical protein
MYAHKTGVAYRYYVHIYLLQIGVGVGQKIRISSKITGGNAGLRIKDWVLEPELRCLVTAHALKFLELAISFTFHI